ncbi:MAG: DUF502 domain-containing protein [Pseudomonadales bacterium]|nr:DUF502 domain-containing protein [Pseudomonadales bacterium]MCP5185729.1 DUF502 domain-containing protein [Pseudomonadales bacterium]
MPEERPSHVGRNLLLGLFTVLPLWVTWLVFDFLAEVLAGIGTPLLELLTPLLSEHAPVLVDWLHDDTVRYLVAVLVTLVAFYGIGLLTSFVLGRRLVDMLESIVSRLPLVQTIYGGTKRFLHSIRQQPATGQRVVLINFPSAELKAVGFLTTTLRDTTTNAELAAVYVPTSPNPTSGYIEIVPMSAVTFTEWTMEEAMTFVVTGGATAPPTIRYASAAPVVSQTQNP